VRPSGRGPVNSPSRITLENNGKIRPQPDRENAFAGASGGEGVFRTEFQRDPGRIKRPLYINTFSRFPSEIVQYGLPKSGSYLIINLIN